MRKDAKGSWGGGHGSKNQALELELEQDKRTAFLQDACPGDGEI
jgi:hypothetical protein